jgi:hypothetical protein
MFERFWQAYPRRVSKGAALKAWLKLKPDAALVEQMLKAIEYQKDWRKKADRANQSRPHWKRIFVPEWKHASTWINQQCWLDEHEEIGTTEAPKPKKTMCATCKTEEGRYPVSGILYCIRCYDRAAHPENYAPKLRLVR